MIGYPYVNMDVTIKNALLMFQDIGFKLKEMVKVYHLGVMKLLPFSPAYIFIVEKGYIHQSFMHKVGVLKRFLEIDFWVLLAS